LARGAKIALTIIMVIIGLFGMAYWGSQISENQKEIDRLKAQNESEVKQMQELKQQLNELNK
jgi:cell division protein FtsL